MYVPPLPMVRPENVATPATALTVAVVLPPANVPPASVSVTAEVSVATVLPNASSTATITGGELPARVGAAGLLQEGEFRRWPEDGERAGHGRGQSRRRWRSACISPGALMTRLLNVATPLTAEAVTVLAPEANVPPWSVSVTVEVSMLTVEAAESSTATWTPPAPLMIPPTAVLAGGRTKANCAGESMV